MKLRDKMWLWGHPEGRYNHLFGNEKESRMTPMECCLYLGIRNTFMIPNGENYTDIAAVRRQYNKSFTTLRNVGWECYDTTQDPEKIAPYIADAAEFPNIDRVVLDDFKRGGKYKDFPIENLVNLHERLRNNGVRPLDMWMVLYTNEFGLDEQEDIGFQPYMDEVDGVIMWTWKESDVALIPEKYELFKKYTPKTRRMFGCYLWNFGEEKEATADAVKWQLDFYLEKIKAGEAEGIVFHTNTMADLDYEAYDAAFEWMAIHGDDEI